MVHILKPMDCIRFIVLKFIALLKSEKNEKDLKDLKDEEKKV